VYVKPATETIRPLLMIGVAALALGGCVDLAKNNYFLPGGVDQRSAVAGEVEQAGRAPGPFPTFAQIPNVPTDVRTLDEWRQVVGETLDEKRATDAEVRDHPFTLADTEGFAQAQRDKIPPAEAAPPADDTAAAEAFAAGHGARANAPPPPKSRSRRPNP
jgi:hypothetical protein